MQWRAASPYIIPLLVAAGFAVFLVLLLWRRRKVPGAYALVSLSLTAAIWSFGYAMEIGMVASAWAIVWARIQYIGIAFLPLAWLVFAYDYTDRRRLLSRRKLALLAIVPVLTQVLVWTNDLHGLIWRNIVLDATLPIPLLVYTHGPGFWLCNLVSHIYLLAGTLILFGNLRRAPLLYVRQIATLLAGTLAPWLANGLYVLELSPWPGLDLTPFAFTFSIAMVALLVLRMRFLDMVPIAYERVVASMTDGVLVLDHQDRVLDMNAAGLASIGKQLHDVIGKPVEQVLVEVPGLLEQYRHVDYLDDEIEIPDGPHGLQVFGVRVSRIMSHDGRPRGRLVVWRDVTERRRAADLLRTQNEELVRLQAFLERAIDEARAANRAKSTFLANISHELRTPLNAILGYSELMQLDLKRERSERFQVELDAVQTAGKQLLDLINSLLDLSKIEAERIELSVDTFGVSELLAEVEQTMFPLIVQAGNSLSIDCAENAGQIHTDRAKLRQILLNLLSNATKFTHRGRIDMRVRRLQHDSGPDMLSIAVQDTGIGIADNDLPLLFQDFVQVDSSSTRRYGGTGLGLAISRRFCHMLGGEISVASSVGVGTTFTVLVPADLEQAFNTEHNDGPPAPTPIIKRAS